MKEKGLFHLALLGSSESPREVRPNSRQELRAKTMDGSCLLAGSLLYSAGFLTQAGSNQLAIKAVSCRHGHRPI